MVFVTVEKEFKEGKGVGGWGLVCLFGTAYNLRGMAYIAKPNYIKMSYLAKPNYTNNG